jgi:hypothetical protein
MNPAAPIMGDSALLRLDRLELDLADTRAQVAALIRIANMDRAQRTLERTDPRTVRTARAHRLLCELADGIGPTSWSTAWAVRLVLTGEDPPPAGCEHIAAMLRDHYDGRAPSQGTVWRAMRRRQTWLEAGLLA